jgi:hypothetical protein
VAPEIKIELTFSQVMDKEATMKAIKLYDGYNNEVAAEVSLNGTNGIRFYLTL